MRVQTELTGLTDSMVLTFTTTCNNNYQIGLPREEVS
jgi:hypothetical protein